MTDTVASALIEARPWLRWAFDRASGVRSPCPDGALPRQTVSWLRAEPLLYAALAEVHDDRAAWFRPSAVEATAVNLLRTTALPPVLRELDDGGVSYVVIKGAAVVASSPKMASLRAVSDVDILVHARDRRRAAELLHRVGFAPSDHTAPISGRWNNEEVFARRGVGPDLEIDLHTGLHRRPLFQSIADEAVKCAVVRAGIRVPPPELALLVIAAHRAKHGFTADIRELVDFRMLVDELTDDAVAALVPLAARHRCAGALYVVCDRVRWWFGSEPPRLDRLWNALRDEVGWRRPLLDKLATLDGPTLDNKPWRRAPFVQLYAPMPLLTTHWVAPIAWMTAHVVLRAADVAVVGPDAVGALPRGLRGAAERVSAFVESRLERRRQ